ncbi:MAG: ABC transporter ATP-binding protein [Rhodospirillales bacterium]|nr:ABC transporter ATP-binding protein [Rhodospirillales bacterium]
MTAPAETADAITFDRVEKRFPGARGPARPVVLDFNLVCAAGETTALVGPSGCGKTTLLNLAAGLLTPDKGTITIGPRAINGPGPDRGVVFQHYALFPWLSVRRNCEFGLAMVRTERRRRRELVERYLAMVGLAPFAEALPKALSGGMKQRCALARALVVGPRALLLDEPFGALDAITRRHLQRELMAILARERKTVLLITHDLDEAILLAHRVLVLHGPPVRVARDIAIPYPFPRNPELRDTPAFAATRAELWRELDHAAPS